MGIKGVKSGAISELRNLTEQKLSKMSKEDLASLVASTSKTITAQIRGVKKEYGLQSPFLRQREDNDMPLPKEIKLKSAMKKELSELKNIARDLAYISRLKTASKSGMNVFKKDFYLKTGKNLKDLSSDDWANIRDKINEGYSSTSAITSYDIENGIFDAIDEIEQAQEKAKLEVDDDLESESPYDL